LILKVFFDKKKAGRYWLAPWIFWWSMGEWYLARFIHKFNDYFLAPF
jgi:hypothetical protein